MTMTTVKIRAHKMVTEIFYCLLLLAPCCFITNVQSEDASSFHCPSNFGYFSDPTDCASYFICTFGSAKPRKCGGNLIYHDSSKTCDEPKPGVCAALDKSPATNNKISSDSTTTTTSAPRITTTGTTSTPIRPSTTPESISPKKVRPSDSSVGERRVKKKPSPPIPTSATRKATSSLNVDDYDPNDRSHTDTNNEPLSDGPTRRAPLLNVGSQLRRQLAASRSSPQSARRPPVHPSPSRRRASPLESPQQQQHKEDDSTGDESPSGPARNGAEQQHPQRPQQGSDRYVRPLAPPKRPSQNPTGSAISGRPPPRDILQPGQRSKNDFFNNIKPQQQQQAVSEPSSKSVTTSIELSSNIVADERPERRQQQQQNSQQKQQQSSYGDSDDVKIVLRDNNDEPQQQQQQQQYTRHSSALPPADKLSPALPPPDIPATPAYAPPSSNPAQELAASSIASSSQCNQSVNCYLPRCYCGGANVPGGFSAREVPQMVVISFDGPVNERNLPQYEELFDNAIVNPNNCPIRGTFFVSHEFTNYGMVRHLYEKGHGIGAHSITYGNGRGFNGADGWRNELEGEKLFLAKFAAINPEHIRGVRAPLFANGGDDQFEAMAEGGFLYDSSLPIPANTRAPLWPYTLDHGTPHSCVIPPCPEQAHTGIWELPLNPIYGLFGESCFAVDRCNLGSTTEQVFSIMYNNFYRNFYQTNRAPFQLALRADWLNYAPFKSGFVKFISVLATMPDVWFVTGSQVVAWMQQPVSSQDAAAQFMPWQCSQPMPADKSSPSTISVNRLAPDSDKPACDVINACPLSYNKKLRYFYTCSECPKRFPWIDDAEQWIDDERKASQKQLATAAAASG